MNIGQAMLLDSATGTELRGRRHKAMRAADANRDRAAWLLRQSLADGRLTVEEYTERLDQAYAARTRRELAHALTSWPTWRTPRSMSPRGSGSASVRPA